MGTKNNPGDFDCYTKAESDEPMFVLLARDPSAPDLVRRWANKRGFGSTGDSGTSAEKIMEALDCADAMEKWHKENRP